jgi:hypothetical protein
MLRLNSNTLAALKIDVAAPHPPHRITPQAQA